ncbi:MAG: signal peptidase I [Oscillospiraceae bacterium]|jgi:signal peptidase|nr:signal peptidase I [Oscillospiraceae bacterium]
MTSRLPQYVYAQNPASSPVAEGFPPQEGAVQQPSCAPQPPASAPSVPLPAALPDLTNILPFSVDLRKEPYIYLAILPNPAYEPPQPREAAQPQGRPYFEPPPQECADFRQYEATANAYPGSCEQCAYAQTYASPPSGCPYQQADWQTQVYAPPAYPPSGAPQPEANPYWSPYNDPVWRQSHPLGPAGENVPPPWSSPQWEAQVLQWKAPGMAQQEAVSETPPAPEAPTAMEMPEAPAAMPEIPAGMVQSEEDLDISAQEQQEMESYLPPFEYSTQSIQAAQIQPQMYGFAPSTLMQVPPVEEEQPEPPDRREEEKRMRLEEKQRIKEEKRSAKEQRKQAKQAERQEEPPQQEAYAPPQEQGYAQYQEQYQAQYQQPLPADPFARQLQQMQTQMPLQEQAPKPRKPVRRLMAAVTNILMFAVVLAVIGGAIAFRTSTDPEKNFFGYRFYNVLTPSMTPTQQKDGTTPKGGFHAGDLIFVKMTEPEEVQVGDIVTFNPDSNAKDGQSTTNLTHRVVEIKDQLGGEAGIYFVTKGDANNAPDPPIPGDAVIGVKVAHIPKLGTILRAVEKQKALAIVMCAAICVLIFTLFYFFSKEEFDEKQPKRKSKKNRALPPQPIAQYAYTQ